LLLVDHGGDAIRGSVEQAVAPGTFGQSAISPSTKLGTDPERSRRVSIQKSAVALNLPNAITIGRIFLVPLLVVVLLTKFEGHLILGVRKELVGAAIFGLASLTDWLDGYLARRRQQVTTLGQFMDPLADKLLITAALVSLVQMDLAQSWMVVVILGREIYVTVLRSLAQARGVAIPASPLGKFKMVSQVIAILLLILGDHIPEFATLGRIVLWIAMITAVASAVDYYRRFNTVIT
jgi:CDP-diacylglycerol--glycerol-3-phosphate 3-phosphatidyltransferase